MSRKQKIRRKRKALGIGKARDFGSPAPRNAVLFPLVDGLDPAIVFAEASAPKFARDNRAAAKSVDQFRVLVLLRHPAVIRNIFGSVKPPQPELSFGDLPNGTRQDDRMAKEDWDPYHIECGGRLRATREALGYEVQKPFTEDTGTDVDNLSNWERGVSLVPPWYVRRLKGVFKITFDWIYDEDASAMPRDLARKLLSKDRRKS